VAEQFIRDAVTGGETPTVRIMDAIGKAAFRIEELASEMTKAKDEDTARWTALNEERKSQAATLTQLQDEYQKAKIAEENERVGQEVADMKAMLASMRAPSKAGALSGGRVASRGGYQSGDFIGALIDMTSRDPEVYGNAKARLSQITAFESNVAKAAVGSSDATGGWIIPNAIVDELITPAAATSPYRQVMTVVSGVTAPAIDLPFRSGRRTAAAVIPFGNEKTNVDLAYNGYTATMYTLAKIHDIGNQFLRQSRGAAERDVLAELGAAFAQGEAQYIRNGTGSGQPYGFLRALANSPATFTSSFTASASTLAGSMAKAIATAAGAVSARGGNPNGAVLSASSYWTMVSQGTDTAGFFFAPANGPSAIRPGTLVTSFGIPVFPDATTDIEGTAGDIDALVVADWSKFKLFLGQAYRVDTSDMAGTRWDYNVTGFRGEMEMAFDARPAVFAGYAQLVDDIVP
jgi:HK97 family phage major capsid protein